jgi:hypothetical protein
MLRKICGSDDEYLCTLTECRSSESARMNVEQSEIIRDDIKAKRVAGRDQMFKSTRYKGIIGVEHRDPSPSRG